MSRKRQRLQEVPASPAPEPLRPLSSMDRLLLAATVVLPFLAYAPSLGGALLWDDNQDLATTPELRTVSGLLRAWTDLFYRQQFYPVTHTVFWIAGHLWGDAPPPYRVLVLALHIASAVLLGFVLRRLRVRGAFVAALLFALHPLNLGTAAWISKLTNTLSAALALGALLVLVPLIPQDPSASPATLTNNQAWKRYGLGVTLFTLAMLSKTAVAPLPVVLVAIIWWKRGKLERELVWMAGPLFVVAAGLGYITSMLEAALYPLDTSSFDWSATDRLLIAGNAIVFYLQKLLVPTGLSFVYPRWSLGASALQYAAVAFAVALPAALFALRARLGRGPVAAVLIGYALLFPALGFFKVWYMRFSFVADHWAYYASMAFIPLAVAASAQLLEKAPRPLAPACAALAVALFGFATWQRAPLFTSEARVWRDALDKDPTSKLAAINFGWQLVQQDRFQDAVELFDGALKAHPTEPRLLLASGFCLMRTGRYDESAATLERALAQPDIDGSTRTKAQNVLKTVRALRTASPEERDRWIERANEYVEAKRRKGR